MHLGQRFGDWNRTLSFDVQLGESLDQNEGSTDGAVLDHDQPRNKSKGKKRVTLLSCISYYSTRHSLMGATDEVGVCFH